MWPASRKKPGFAEARGRRRQFFLNSRFYEDILFGLTREEFVASLATSG